VFKISEIYATNELHKTLQLKEILNISHRSTLFSQILSFIPRHIFQKLEHRHKAGRASRKFGFKEQFTVMAFLQLAARRSMRDGIRALSDEKCKCKSILRMILELQKGLVTNQTLKSVTIGTGFSDKILCGIDYGHTFVRFNDDEIFFFNYNNGQYLASTMTRFEVIGDGDIIYLNLDS
jgi:hypothetical protein